MKTVTTPSDENMRIARELANALSQPDSYWDRSVCPPQLHWVLGCGKAFDTNAALIAAALQAKDAEAFSLSANQCHNGYGDDYGNHRCKYQDEIDSLKAQLAAKDAERERAVKEAREKALHDAAHFVWQCGCGGKDIKDIPSAIRALKGETE